MTCLASEPPALNRDTSDDPVAFVDEKRARFSFFSSVPPSRSYTPDSAYRSSAHDHDTSSLAFTAAVDLGPQLSQPASSGSLPASEDPPRPRHIDDVVREKLNRARVRAGRSNAVPSVDTTSQQIEATRGGATVTECRQAEDGGIRLAGGRLGERIRGADASGGVAAVALQEDAWSTRRHSIQTLPPPYAEH